MEKNILSEIFYENSLKDFPNLQIGSEEVTMVIF